MIRRFAVLVLACGIMGAAVVGGTTPKFFPDDPIRVDPETQDASAVREWDVSDAYDFIEASFLGPGDDRDVRAVNVNTIDEVPDSSWFVNRLGAREMSADEVTTGPVLGTGPAPGPWTIVSGKNEGIAPGLTIVDCQGDRYFIKFDPPSNPEMATGAEVITTQFFHALGYHVPENYIAVLDPGNLRIDPAASIKGSDGRLRSFRPADLEAVFARSAVNTDGRYRVVASKALPGTPLGPFRYHGTRPDDPNDIYPHEHRRELRGLRVFAAWLNHDEALSNNTFDTLVEHDGRRIVRHHLIDFGSTLGSGTTAAQKPRAGNEYVWETRPTVVTMLTLGFYVRPWIKVQYPPLPAVGRFEGSFFAPERWKPDYPNQAFDNMRADDAFWAARLLTAFEDDLIRGAVKSGRFIDPEAEAYLAEVMIARKHKILAHWLNGVLPLADFTFSRSGTLAFTNVSIDAGAAEPPSAYRIRWFTFDNRTGTAATVGEAAQITGLETQAPAALFDHRPEFVLAELQATHPRHPGWGTPLKVYFRRQVDGEWAAVGIERQP